MALGAKLSELHSQDWPQDFGREFGGSRIMLIFEIL